MDGLDGLAESGDVPGDGGVVVVVLLPVLDSLPPGEVAAPVEYPGVIPKCVNTL